MARGRYRGRGGGGGRGRGRGGGGGGGNRQYQDNRQSFDQVDKRNDKLERFYNTLNVVPEGPERDAFWAALRRELPNSFRFTGSKGHALSVRNNLVERFFPLISKIQHEGKPVDIPRSMSWYPEGLAYTMTTPKNVVRKYEPFKEFQRFLVSETGVGNISRQEHVSMIPPLLLDVRSEHTVLDLCAAPGSKSAQLIEAIHSGEEERAQRAIAAAKSGSSDNDDATLEDQGRATGLLIANDVNYQRAQMLVHQVKRLNSPNLIVMNHDATMFPSIELPSDTAPGKQKQGRYLKFDRILADVPCSGDGTTRKNPSIWKEWSPQNGLGLYITQVRILTRSLQMLRVGGRVVYSTCSMNPVEDEAVVSSAIERCGGVGKVKLIDCSKALPDLVRSPGLTDWSIMSRTGQIFESWPEAEQHEAEGSKIVPGMFAPEPEEKIPLPYCMRVYPHQQDTGGFFIAVLEKQSEIKAKPENESKCMHKQWKYSAPVEEPKNTAFGELMADVRSEPVDSGGHSHRTNGEGVIGDGNETAAQRSNDLGPAADGLKRKATELEDIDAEPKRLRRLGDDDPEYTSTADTTRTERYPLPPSVALGVEASGGQPGADVVGGANAAQGESSAMEGVKQEVQDASANAPFTPAKPAMRNGRKPDGQANVEAFKYLDPDHPELVGIYNFYGLHPSFPRDRFLVRNPAGDPVKGIYYSSQLVKDILNVNAEGKGMKFVHAGVKMFMKQDSQGQDICRWRIQTEGLPIIEGWVGEGRVVHLTKRATLRKLLVEMFPRLGRTKDDSEEGWKKLDEIGEQVRDIGMGCCVLRVEASDDPDGFTENLTLPLWRSLHSLNLMLPKEDRRAMLLRIYNEDVELVNNYESSKSASAVKKEEDGGVKGEPGVKREPGIKSEAMSNEHKASSIKEEDADSKPAVKQENGSIPAEEDAKHLQDIVKHTDNSAVVDDAVLGAGVDAKVQDAELDGSARALEEDAVAKKDEQERERLEAMEDPDVKLANAMPERVGEGDDYNTTV